MDNKTEKELWKNFDKIREFIGNNNLDQAVSKFERIDSRTLPEDLKYGYYYLAGDIHYVQDDFDDAIIFYNLALKNFKLDNEDRAKIYSHLGGIYFDKELYSKAIEYSNKAIELSNNKRIITKTLSTLGFAYQNLDEFEKSVTQFLQILSLYKEIRTDDWSKYMIENAYASLGFSYWKLTDEQKAEYYFQKLISLKDANPHELKRGYLCKAHRFYEKRQWKEAVDYYNKAMVFIDNEEEKQCYQKYIDDCKGWLAKNK